MQNLLEEGIIISKDGLGCLSTPMGEAEVDRFVSALERAVARLPKAGFGSRY
jgi:glutamate-1-semialdehyde aminotransferase